MPETRAQYVGARYVPRFSEPLEWQENLTYEPLTIVTRSGNSYTSKKSVPAGIDPFTNSEYWACTGNYSAQIEEYRNKVVEISEKMNAIDTEFDTVKTEFATLSDKVDNAKTVYSNIVVPTSAFSADTTYTGYNFRAAIAKAKVKKEMVPEVVFSPADATGGNFCPVADSFDGGIYIYSESVPGGAVTIPTIIVWR